MVNIIKHKCKYIKPYSFYALLSQNWTTALIDMRVRQISGYRLCKTVDLNHVLVVNKIVIPKKQMNILPVKHFAK